MTATGDGETPLSPVSYVQRKKHLDFPALNRIDKETAPGVSPLASIRVDLYVPYDRHMIRPGPQGPPIRS
ncbi:MAG: hypothetical protein Alpg2KO_30230 [Alphaproteobacteria bacterium]